MELMVKLRKKFFIKDFTMKGILFIPVWDEKYAFQLN